MSAEVDWLAAAHSATGLVIEAQLGGVLEDVDFGDDDAATAWYASVDVLAPGAPVHIGFVAAPAVAEVLARRMYGLADDAPLPEGDVRDALGELANIIAGATKAMVASTVGVLALGRPHVDVGAPAGRVARVIAAGLPLSLIVS